MSVPPFTAVVLAADRSAHDPLLAASGACCKAMIRIDGLPMLEHVVRALISSDRVGDIVISEALASGSVRWTRPQSSPSDSAYQAMKGLPDDVPVLVTTADHPLLRADIVDDFLQRSVATGADVGVGLTDYASIKARFPAAKKTVTRFRDGGYCGCNLFAFMTPASHRVAAAWRRVEQQRKNPLRIISQLGWWSVLRYLLGRMTLDGALGELSQRLRVAIAPVHLPYPEAAIDVDSIADQKLVEGIAGSEK
jgi:GTP:adenosylcobinamide-phosphate guanylyltransferase